MTWQFVLHLRSNHLKLCKRKKRNKLRKYSRTGIEGSPSENVFPLIHLVILDMYFYLVIDKEFIIIIIKNYYF